MTNEEKAKRAEIFIISANKQCEYFTCQKDRHE